MSVAHTVELALGEKGVACLMVIAGCLLLVGLVVMLGSAGRWAVRSQEQMEPRAVIRRAVEIQRRIAERRIAEIGEETRAAIRAAAERRRRYGSK